LLKNLTRKTLENNYGWREFGFDNGETLENDIYVCRTKINTQALDTEAHRFKLPTNSQILFQSVEHFAGILGHWTPDIAHRTFRLDAILRSAYGLDGLANFQSGENIGVAINDYDFHRIKTALDGDIFRVHRYTGNNRQGNNFFIINLPVCERILQLHQNEFPASLGTYNMEDWILNNIINKISNAKYSEVPQKEYGLLSGIPVESAKNYPLIQTVRNTCPEFNKVYTGFLGGTVKGETLMQNAHQLSGSQQTKKLLLRILAEQVRFGNVKDLSDNGFLLLCSGDFYYAQRRKKWFQTFDEVYKPLMRQLMGG